MCSESDKMDLIETDEGFVEDLVYDTIIKQTDYNKKNIPVPEMSV
jgi:hypothetical protein